MLRVLFGKRKVVAQRSVLDDEDIECTWVCRRLAKVCRLRCRRPSSESPQGRRLQARFSRSQGRLIDSEEAAWARTIESCRGPQDDNHASIPYRVRMLPLLRANTEYILYLPALGVPEVPAVQYFYLTHVLLQGGTGHRRLPFMPLINCTSP